MTTLELSRDQALEKSVVSKVLVRLVPFLAILYLFNLMDRGNVSIAALTMKKDLNFNDQVYGFGAGIFFLGYFILEVPSNLIMQRVGARKWIARIMMSWGAISTCMMFVRNPASFYTLRFMLGLAEAGFYPGILLYLTYWVPGRARARILGRFLALNGMLGLLGTPLGLALMRMNGIGGLTGWQWLFLIEGLPSVLLAFVVLRILPDGPNNVLWLTQEEKTWITESLAAEERAGQQVKHLSFRVALSEPRILHLCLIFILTSTAGNAVGFFGPELLKVRSGGAWSDSLVIAMMGIPGLIGACVMIFAAAHSDRTNSRRQHVVIGYIVASIGFLLCVYAPTAGLTVVALSINVLGERGAASSYWALTTNLMGARAAAGGIAFINSVGNLGGFIGPYLMGALKTHTGGGFRAGLFTATALFCAAAFAAYLLRRDGPGHPTPTEEFVEETAAISQPEQHIP